MDKLRTAIRNAFGEGQHRACLLHDLIHEQMGTRTDKESLAIVHELEHDAFVRVRRHLFSADMFEVVDPAIRSAVISQRLWSG